MKGSIVRLLPFLAVPWTRAEIPRDASAGNPEQECAAPGDDGACAAAAPPSSSVYVIGDLHGDAACAVAWVRRTGLIENLLADDAPPSAEEDALPLFRRLNAPSTWRWTDAHAALVFMGDYVDKGPTSRQTVQFVRDVERAFPDRVTALIGNHELELLRDRDARIAPADRYGAFAYATVHPGEYHNYFLDPKRPEGMPANATAARPLDEKDNLVLDLLYEAAMEVYASRAHAAVRFVPSLPAGARRQGGAKFAITDLMPPQHRPLARQRLAEYIEAYYAAFRSDSVLGKWLEQRPVVHLAEHVNTLFVHGGVSPNVAKAYLSGGKESVDKLNAIWRDHSHESKLLDFLEGKRAPDVDNGLGHAVYDLLTYRGNHPGYENWKSHGTVDESGGNEDEACEALRGTLGHMEGITRIAVGHTPNDDVRIGCDGAFLALDSALGRWIRASGNDYCPGPAHFAAGRRAGGAAAPAPPRTSRDGRYRCAEVQDACEGQIVRLDADGAVHVLRLDQTQNLT